MRDLDEIVKQSLRSDGGEYRPVLPDPEGAFVRRYRRRRATNIAAAAVLVALMGSAAGYGLHSLRRTGTIGPVQTPSVVPWTDATPSSESPEVTTPEAPAGTRACTSDDVAARYSGANGAAGTLGHWLTFANSGSSLCALQGVPAIRLLDASGRALPFQQSAGSFFGDNGNERVALQPGVRLPAHEDDPAQPGNATVVFEWQDCTLDQKSIATIEVGLPSGGGTIRIAAPAGGLGGSGYAACDSNPTPAGPGTINVSHFRSVPPPPPPEVDYSKLALSVRAPAAVRPGERVRYEITLTNEADTDFVFEPCPAYFEIIGGAGVKVVRRYLLNCAAAGAIPAGRAVTFEMYLQIPDDAKPGTGVLSWDFEGGTGVRPPATPARITILAS